MSRCAPQRACCHASKGFAWLQAPLHTSLACDFCVSSDQSGCLVKPPASVCVWRFCVDPLKSADPFVDVCKVAGWAVSTASDLCSTLTLISCCCTLHARQAAAQCCCASKVVLGFAACSDAVCARSERECPASIDLCVGPSRPGGSRMGCEQWFKLF